MIDKIIRVSDENKTIVLDLVKSGLKSDGVMELYIQTPEDASKYSGEGYIPSVNIGIKDILQFERVVGAEIKIDIEDDPRLKAWSLSSSFGTFWTVVHDKHCPEKIDTGLYIYDVLVLKGRNWFDEKDVFGPSNKSYEPFVLQFRPNSINELGLVRGWDDLFQIYDLRGEKTYYDFEDHMRNPIIFGKVSQSFEHSTGNSIMDKINQLRLENSLLPLHASDEVMLNADNYAQYIQGVDFGSQVELTWASLKDQFEYFGVNLIFSEYHRLTYKSKPIEALEANQIDLEYFYDEAITYWMNTSEGIDNILRNEYNSFGSGEVVYQRSEISDSKRKWIVYLVLDLAKIKNVSTRQTSTNSQEADYIAKYRAKSTQYRYGTNYEFEINAKPRFFLDSHNPICSPFSIVDNQPVPNAIYKLYGFFNDMSVLNDRQRLAANANARSGENPDPTLYPVLLGEVEFKCHYMEYGIVTEVSGGENTFYKYAVDVNGSERKNVQSFSRVKYEVGRNVIIHKSENGWFVIPSSSLYHLNLKRNLEK
jgi:uncharacterized protein YkwD